jgi:membrane-bound lytic murein transglycosylase B
LRSTKKKLLSALVLSLFFVGASHAEGFAGDPEAEKFIAEMVAKNGFTAEQLQQQFAAVSPNDKVLRAIMPAATAERRSWSRYRERFVNERRIQRGVAFWNEHAATLARARALYGVPEEIVVALIGVETEYGRNTGRFSVLEALATLAFRYPPRADFFRRELENFLILSRDNRLDPLAVRGSYAGAIGIPQFMPSSERRFAVDFDRDGRIDLSNSVDDAIGSVAAYLGAHDWHAGEPIASRLSLAATPAQTLVDAGIKPSLGEDAWRTLPQKTGHKPPEQAWALVDLVTPGGATEYWAGFDNFYAITRYNRSSFYGMAVFQLGEAIRKARPNGSPAT